MTLLDKLIGEANAAGYSIANLYQLMSHPAFIHARPQLTGEWQCNFRNGRDHYEYGRGASIEEAVGDALRLALRKIVQLPPAPSIAAVSLESLE